MGTTTGHVRNQKFEGGRYTGYIEHKLQEGEGRVEYSNGDIFDGCWKKGKREGQGTLKKSNGTMYVGMWKLGELHGPGIIFKRKGEKFEGEFIYGELNGTVTHRDCQGNIYIGEYKNENYSGYGVMSYADGNVYNGEWNNGLYHGEGEFIFKDGKSCKGFFRDGLMEKSYEDIKRSESVGVDNAHRLKNYEVTKEHHRGGSKPVPHSKHRKNSLVNNQIHRDPNKYSRKRLETPVVVNDGPYYKTPNYLQTHEFENSDSFTDINSTINDELESERSQNSENYYDEGNQKFGIHHHQKFNQAKVYYQSPHFCNNQSIPIMNNLCNQHSCTKIYQNIPQNNYPPACYHMVCNQCNNFGAVCCSQLLNQNIFGNKCCNNHFHCHEKFINPQGNQNPNKINFVYEHRNEVKTDRSHNGQIPKNKIFNFNNR